jgi:hypothetical protein
VNLGFASRVALAGTMDTRYEGLVVSTRISVCVFLWHWVTTLQGSVGTKMKSVREGER